MARNRLGLGFSFLIKSLVMTPILFFVFKPLLFQEKHLKPLLFHQDLLLYASSSSSAAVAVVLLVLILFFFSVIILYGGWVLNSLLHYMLPRKRVVGEVDTENLLKRPKIGDSFISTEENNHSNTHSVMAACDDGGNPPDIDEDLHSRQLAVYGRETMRRLFGANVLISGMQGLGAEVAKNLVLAGVKSVTLHDEGAVELWDLSSNFFFSEDVVGKNRALSCVQKLQELNSSVVISTITTELSKEQLSNFQCSGMVRVLNLLLAHCLLFVRCAVQ